ncbi:MAG: DUF1326 domain-containing protein [Phycisphaerales bacterium]|nr:DUF1326 domain-containing protein [Phycisphaerales bacterium]
MSMITHRAGSVARLFAAASVGAVTFLVAGLAGCAPDAERPGMAVSTTDAMLLESLDWELNGSRIIACCCGTPCPCRLNKAPTNCHGCDNSTAVHIDRGQIDGVRMDGLDWIIVGRVFGQDPTLNWHYVYVSEQARAEQMAALEKFFTMSMAAIEMKKDHLTGSGLGMRRVPIRWDESSDGREWSAEVPGVLVIQTRSIIVPGQKEAVRSTGIFDDYGNSFTHADTLEHTLNDREIDRKWNLKGRQANQAHFAITDEIAGKGGMGWGCWSANAKLGGDSQYGEQLIGHD